MGKTIQNLLSVTTVLVAGGLFITAFSGCEIKNPNNSGGQGNGIPEAVEIPIVKAVGWDDIVLDGGGIQTKYGVKLLEFGIDNEAHYKATTNGCALPGEDGAILSNDDWNNFAKSVNTFINSPVQTDEICFTSPMAPVGVFDSLSVKIGNQKRELIKGNYSEVCTRLTDIDSAKAMLAAMRNVLIFAGKQGCPDYHPPY